MFVFVFVVVLYFGVKIEILCELGFVFVFEVDFVVELIFVVVELDVVFDFVVVVVVVVELFGFVEWVLGFVLVGLVGVEFDFDLYLRCL